MSAAAPPDALRGRSGSGGIRAVFLAVVVHAAFFALIVFGVSWQNRPTPAVEVELWDKLPPAEVTAAPEPAKTQPPPEPAKTQPPPEPVKPPEPVRPPEPPKAEVKPPPPKPVEKPAPPKPDAEIAERLERQKLEREKREREKAERLERQKAAEAKKREEDEARKKAEADKKKREDDRRRREEEAARAAALKAQEEAAAARRSEFDGWVAKIRSKIRGRANVPDSVTGSPEVHVAIRLLPGGEVLDIQIIKRSGNAAYDSAIERGIRSASPLPVPPANSELFPQFRELNLVIRHER